MKNIIYAIALFFSGTVFFPSSCKKFVQIPPPKNQLVSSTVFADSAGANAAIIGIYVNMMQSYSLAFANGGITLYTGLAGDEFYESGNNTTDEAFYNNAITIDNGENSVLWENAYQFIYDANACIEGVHNSTGIGATAKKSLSAEAYFIRSFIYFNLVNVYGEVPLVTTTDYNAGRLIGQSSQGQVYTQIIVDLLTAQANLPQNSAVNTRANYYAATALLAKVYLYNGQYSNADAEAEKVINSGNYTLATDLNTVFLASSTETIWSFAPVVPNQNTWEGYHFVQTSAGVTPTYILTNSLLNSFEPGDLRKAAWINADTVSGQVYPYPYKYKAGETSGTPTENYVVLRLAEQYLIAAEAKANANDPAGAMSDLNIIRQRAGLPLKSGLDQASLLQAIEQERRTELFCEWGNRWFDLNRTGRATAVFATDKPTWKTYAALFPIPQPEITANPNLKQNSGY
ncbi:RagB/SusD family nutrient uptake outer membrane protein [Mucilaginibacter sp.]